MLQKQTKTGRKGGQSKQVDNNGNGALIAGIVVGCLLDALFIILLII